MLVNKLDLEYFSNDYCLGVCLRVPGYPPEGYPPPKDAYPPPGYPPQGYPQGYPPQGYPPQYPPQYAQPPPQQQKQSTGFLEGWYDPLCPLRLSPFFYVRSYHVYNCMYRCFYLSKFSKSAIISVIFRF